jgi:hypothetical protein
MPNSENGRGRRRPLASAALLLLALSLLAVGVQGADVPRYVRGDILEIAYVNTTEQIVIAGVDTTSLATPLYTAFMVDQNAGRWEIPRYWHGDLEYTEEQLVQNSRARRVAHVDPVSVIITDTTITGGDMLYAGLSLWETRHGVLYAVEPPPGELSGYPNVYVVGDILGNVSSPDRGSVVASVYESDGATWYRVYYDAVKRGDRWVLDKYYNNDMGYTALLLDQNGMRRVAHADPHTVIVNDTTTSTGDIGWYRLSLAEIREGKSYDQMGNWHFNTGDIVADRTSGARYIVGNATVSDSGPSRYILYEVVSGANGWEIPSWVNGGLPFEVSLGAPREDLPFDLADHTDPHFAVVTDPTVADGVMFSGLSLGELLEGTPGYPPELPEPVGGDRGFFLVSTTPAGAEIYLEDISGTRYLQGNTSAGPLNVTVYLTATPIRAVVAILPGYRDYVHTVTAYPAKGQTVALDFALVSTGGGPSYKPLSFPGRVEAEDYDVGGFSDTTPANEGGAYRNDAVDIEVGGSNYDVGWIRDGESLQYTVNVTETANYYLALRVASPNSYKRVLVSFDGGQEMWVLVPNTGSFSRFATATEWETREGPGATGTMTPQPTATGLGLGVRPVRLTAGTHTLTLRFVGDGQNIDWIEFTTAEPASGGIAYKQLSIPGTIQAEDYDLGGQNVGYYDTTSGNSGGAYRHDDVDIESSGGVTNVGWIREGEWLTYTADVAASGQYTLTARVASPNSGRTILVLVDGASVATIGVPRTGSFSTWQTTSVQVPLASGQHTLRLMFTGDGQNIDWIAFSAEGTTPPITTTPVPSGGASFAAVPTTAPKGGAVKFTLVPASGKAIRSAWWSFDAPAHLNTWNSRTTNPTFYYPAKGTFSPLVKITYADGSTETVQRTGYVRVV